MVKGIRRKQPMTPEERAYWDRWLKKPYSDIVKSALEFWKDKPMRGLNENKEERKGGWGVQV